MSPTLPPKVQHLRDRFFASAGHTTPDVRRAIVARAAELALGSAEAPAASQVPEGLRGYVEKVALHAYRVTDDDTAAMKAAGFSEDAIFEATLAAALGAGVRRLELGLAALNGSR